MGKGKNVIYKCPNLLCSAEIPDSLADKKDGLVPCPECGTNMTRRVKK
jgi:DNA-directed RNA polymerase subunit RPC12/RpoP